MRICFSASGAPCPGVPPDCLGAYDTATGVTDPSATCASPDFDSVQRVIVY